MLEALEEYILSMVKWEYIDTDKSFVKGKTIFLNINTTVLPTPNINVKLEFGTGLIAHSVKDLFENHLFNPCNIDTGNFYITVTIDSDTDWKMDLQKSTPLTDSGFIGTGYRKIISYILETIELENNPKFLEYQSQINGFLDQMYAWILSKLRNHNIFYQVRGNFVTDRIDDDIYIHLRKAGYEYLYYIIGDCYNALNKDLSFVSIDNGKGNMFVSVLNT